MTALIRWHWLLLLTALQFLTRIPVKLPEPYDHRWLQGCSVYFPVVGCLVGIVSAGAYWLTEPMFDSTIAAVISVAVSLLLTGAFHEDGLADTADGFGGGHTVDDKLRIMKDSRVGTYGVVILVVTLMLKVLTTASLNNPQLIIAGHVISRAFAVTFISALPYVSEAKTSKSKPLSTQLTKGGIVSVIAIALLTMLLLPMKAVLPTVVCLLLLWLIVRKLFLAQIGGYTGDNLGAAQQLSEAILLMACAGALGVSID
ncbi:adenosylcobinamide-GDP ribazoletransferase [Corallincola platygyrae]|uniref:Adenosylcobinamide-GDP ribazoletransferase n=1 Tax=Corallincola platygyrae TaxID=1193278 RepID=A0ABW4XG74_9GAMM